jgi:hypothetical protein
MDSLQFSVWANPCNADVVTTVLTLPLETAIDTPTVCLEVEPSGRGLDSVFTIDQYTRCFFPSFFSTIPVYEQYIHSAMFSVLSLSIYMPTAICLLV